jgi:hypothetical protein
MAPPMPWITLMAIKKSPLVANGMAKQLRVYNVTPMRKIAFLPRMSAILPIGIKTTAEERR